MMMLLLYALAVFVATALAESTSTSTNTATTITTQDLAGLPICAQNCLANRDALENQGSCSSVDIKCLCSNVQYINTIACCLDTKCSPSDQQKAVSFNVNLCNRVNVTIPNFLGCAVTGSAGSLGATVTQGQTSAANTITGVGSVVTIASTAPVAKFTGGALLTGACSSTMYASATLGSGTILEYPWEGCSFDNPKCCPFDVEQPAPLSVCPADYSSTSGACCPSGWSVYPSALYGSQTPCYTTPSIPLTAPITARALGSASTSIITTQLFSLRYPLKSHSGLSAAAKGGIAAGVTVGVLLIATLIIFFILRRRRARKAFEKEANKGPTFVGPMDITNSRSGTMSPWSAYPGSVTHSRQQSEHPISELPSPTTENHRISLHQNELWFPQTQTQQKVEMPPVEMLGDTHLDQHHPAFAGGSGDGVKDAEGIPRPRSRLGSSRTPDRPRSPEEILRPGSRLGSSRAPGGPGMVGWDTAPVLLRDGE